MVSTKNTDLLHYSIGKIGLQIRYSPKSIARDINNLFTRYNFIYPTFQAKPTITLSIRVVHNISLQALRKARLILRFHTYSFRVYKRGGSLFLTDNSNLLILQPRYRRAILIIPERNNANLPSILGLFVIIAVIELLGHQNYFYLHAAGVNKNGHRILFVSDNGQGKSTSALKLFLEGWKYLSDDLVLLRRNNKRRVNALSLTSQLSIRKQNPILKEDKFCFLRKLFKADARKGVYQINMASLAPNKIIRSFIPGTILFSRITDSEFSVLKPLKSSEALLLLIRQSKYIFLGQDITGRKTEILFDLINQVKSYALEIGRDIQEGRASLSDLISCRVA